MTWLASHFTAKSSTPSVATGDLDELSGSSHAAQADSLNTAEARDRLTSQLFAGGDHVRTQGRGRGYCEPGGGEFYQDPSLYARLSSAARSIRDEFSRTNYSSMTLVGSGHVKPPPWIEYKEVAIDGSPLREDERSDPTYWRNKYSRQLDIADAVFSVKQKRLVEETHDVIGFVNNVRRWLGLAPPTDQYMLRRLDELNVKEEELPSHHKTAYRNASSSSSSSIGTYNHTHSAPTLDTNVHSIGNKRAYDSDSAHLAHGPRSQAIATDNFPTPAMHSHARTPQSPLSAAVDAEDSLFFEPGKLVDMPQERAQHEGGGGSLWKVLMDSVERGKPLTHVVQQHRPRIDFYGLDAFLDSAASLMWLSVKVGIAVGLLQGTVRAFQAINVDTYFLKASGVGALSILNMSVGVSVIKWGGNMALLSGAFCIGDRLAQAAKYYLVVPQAHDRRLRHSSYHPRTTVNYAVGLACSGATVAVMPWWILKDATLASRMAVSGMCVGGLLGVGVGVVLGRLVMLNMSRLDASNRQLRRYEALLLRSREWTRAERVRCNTSGRAIWW